MSASLFRKIFFFFFTSLLVMSAGPVHAHEATLGGSKWCFGKNRILAAIELGASLFPEIKGIKERGYHSDSLSDEELKGMIVNVIQPYISEKLFLSVNGKAHPVKVDKVILEGTLWRIWISVGDLEFTLPENRTRIDYRLLFEETNNAHVNIAYLYISDAPAAEVQNVFDYTHPVEHHSFDPVAPVWELSIQGAQGPAAATEPASHAADSKGLQQGNTVTAAADIKNASRVTKKSLNRLPASQKLMFNEPETAQRSQPSANAVDPVKKSAWQDAGTFIVLGIKHILTGYDHIAFLLALIVIRMSFPEVLKIITAFTVAHSITLLLAALQIVSLNSKFVEIIIAFSICYVALENLLAKKVNYRWIVTFGFGLIHGFGFASVLQDFIVGKSNLVVSVLSFNIGVEIGQLMIFLVLLPLLHLLRNTIEFRKITVAVSAAILVLSLTWVIERVFDMKLLWF